MDLLDRVAVAGRDLLARVDEALLATGAPDGHPIWTALRRVGALPGDAFGTVVALRPEPLSAAAADLRALAESYARLDVRPADEWTGLAADAYAVRWRDLARHLGGSADPGEASLSGRLAATAAYLAEVADWASAARLELARALGAVLGSAEALRLRTTPDPVPDAAAAIGVHVLVAVAAAHDEGRALADRWTDRLGELPYRPAAAVR